MTLVEHMVQNCILYDFFIFKKKKKLMSFHRSHVDVLLYTDVI